MKLGYNCVAIGGDPGSGKSTTIDLLKQYGLNSYSVGDVMRKWHVEEIPEISFTDYYRQLPESRMVDANIKLKEMVDSKQIQIADTRLVDIFDSSVLKVGLFCPRYIRARRVSERTEYQGKDIEYIMNDLKRREKDEVKNVRKTRKALVHRGFEYPINEEGKTIKDFNDYNHRNNHYYDGTLNTENLKPQQVAKSIVTLLSKSF